MGSDFPTDYYSIPILRCCFAGRGDGERQGAAVVLQTLVPNARQIFKSLAEFQLNTDDASGGFGRETRILIRGHEKELFSTLVQFGLRMC